MEAYKDWVRRNKDYVYSLESLASGMTWLLPERFSSSEIVPEAVSSVLGIITAVNQHIIDTIPRRWPMQPIQPVKHATIPYSLCISAFKEIEMLVEVIAEQLYGEDKKWNIIAATEGIKVLLRLAVLRDSGYKMLLRGGEEPNTEKVEDDALDPLQKLNNINRPGLPPIPGYIGNHSLNTWNREGRALSALSRLGQNARMVYDSAWSNRMQHNSATLWPPEQVQVVERPSIGSILSEKSVSGAFFLMGEVFFILRPLIYVLLIRKYGRRSWTPWVVSLFVDLVGMSATLQATKRRQQGMEMQIQLSSEEKEEIQRRKLLWAYYVMRDPFFCNYTKRRLESTQKTLEPIPIVGVITEKVFELIFGAQTRYTYISGS